MALFNVMGSNSGSNGALQGRGYTVDHNGEIDFPVLGLVKIQGYTRNEVERLIKRELVSRDLCKDPVVIAEFSGMTFSVLGDVGGPGTKQITKDQITLLEAIAMAGDLQINGKRKNVMVLRQENGQQRPYWIDMTNTNTIYNSPVYYVKQNDIIYVEPNNVRKRQSTVNGSTVFTPAFWMSITSFLVGLSAIFIK
jgi:polysaccharide export outer membrane protein